MKLSQFTNQMLAKEAGFDFVAAHFKCEENRFDKDNPQGYVNFGSAQNFLHHEELQSRLDKSLWEESDSRYQSFRGTSECRNSIATYLESLAGTPIDKDHIVVGNGIISLLEALSIALLDEGDTVLVPTPVFPGLVAALRLRTKARISHLPLDPAEDFRLSPTDLDAAITREVSQGKPVKCVLLCSPGNPVGQVFSDKEIAAFIEITREHNCALIIDEVYASSCFEGTTFHSALSDQAKHVFVLGGLSKDFGLAGYATGWVHGTHERVMKAVKSQAHFYRLPTLVQRCIQSILAPEWRLGFTAINRRLLSRQYEESRDFFTSQGIDVVPAEAGLCLWLDLGNYLSSHDSIGQMQLYEELLETFRVHISPGSSFYCNLPNYFRICFSQDTHTLREGLRRIENGLNRRASLNPITTPTEETLS